MKLFGGLYQAVLRWAAHRHAPWYLGGLSFAESTFFPIPPDVMLAPMTLAKPDRGWFYAGLCTVMSVLGGIFGYLIGVFAFQALEPYLIQWGYADKLALAVEYFERYGFWFILVAGFSPIPYKVFTISAGVVGMPWLSFGIGSLLGRGGRFFLVAGLIILGGEKLAKNLEKYVELLGWLAVLLVGIVIVWLQFRV